MRVKYSDYVEEIERTKEKLEQRTCVKDVNRMIWFVNTGDNVIWLSLNVAGTGRMRPKEAIRFAECIKEAAELADNFKYNGYVLVY